MRFTLLAFVLGLGLCGDLTQISAPLNSQVYYINSSPQGNQLYKLDNAGGTNNLANYQFQPLSIIPLATNLNSQLPTQAPASIPKVDVAQYAANQNNQISIQNIAQQTPPQNPVPQYILPVSASSPSAITLTTQNVQQVQPVQVIQTVQTVQPLQQAAIYPTNSQLGKSIQPINVDGKWFAYSTNLIKGKDNLVEGYYNKIQGQNNVLAGQDNDISGEKNKIQGTKNKISGITNLVSGKNNIIGSRGINVADNDLFGDFFSDEAFWGKSNIQKKTVILDEEKC